MSPLRLDLARARAALGGLLATSATLAAEARDLLSSALALADDCDAEGLWREVAGQLRRLGVDVPEQRQKGTRLTRTSSGSRS